ncbi:MAG: MFS transporter [Deltaproteobacteria bacterium]|nr:MFS transporter [Deltaproteobacteria bacterium]
MESSSSLWSRGFIGICLCNFFTFFSFFAFMATIPLFVRNILKHGDLQIGLTLTAFFLGSVIISPISGKLADEYDKRKILIVSLILFVAISALYLLTYSLYSLLVLRFLHGVIFGITTTLLAVVAADIIPQQYRGEGFAYFITFMSIASVVGPFLGLTVIAHYSFNALFILCTVFSILNFLSLYLAQLPTSPNKTKTDTSNLFNLNKIIEPKAIPISLCSAVTAIAYAGIGSFITLYAIEIGMGNLASYFFVVFAAGNILFRPFAGRLFDRKGANIVIYPFILLYAIGLVLLSQGMNPIAFLMSAAIIGISYGTLFSTFQTIAVTSASIQRRGMATSTFFLSVNLGVSVGAVILGIIAEHSNYHFMFIVTAVFVALSAIIYYIFYHRKNNQNYLRIGNLKSN